MLLLLARFSPDYIRWFADWTWHPEAGFKSALPSNAYQNPILFIRFLGAMFGLAVGDALGAPNEFQPRDKQTITGMQAGGVFNLSAGTWTDDTSMALCLAYSLCKQQGFDANHQMQSYCYWWINGALSATDECFDIGIGTREALQHYKDTGEAFAGSPDPQKAGNGSLMRLAPVVLYYYPDFEKCIYYAEQSARTTHQAPEVLAATRYFAALLFGALKGECKQTLLSPYYSPVQNFWHEEAFSPALQAVIAGSYKQKSREQIRSTGYVVDSLEAALWAFYHAEDFKQGALLAVNLGGDADTIGAIHGQLAGAFFTVDGIPSKWIFDIRSAATFVYYSHHLYTKQNLSVKRLARRTD